MKNDLTLGEVEEARKHGLDADKWDELKTLFESRSLAKLQQKLREEASFQAKAAKEAYEKELRPKVREELRAEIRAEVTSKFSTEQKLEMRKQVEEEIASTGPTPRQREAARRTAREIELDAMTSCRAASSLASAEAAAYAKQRRFRQPLLYTLYFTVLPVLAYCHVVLGWRADWTVPFWATALTYLFAIITTMNVNVEAYKKAEARLKGFRIRTREFRDIATRAREIRMVRVDTANTKGDLVALLQQINQNPTLNDNDAELVLPAETLEVERVRVRDAMAADMDVDRFLPNGDDEEDPPPQKNAA